MQCLEYDINEHLGGMSSTAELLVLLNFVCHHITIDCLKTRFRSDQLCVKQNVKLASYSTVNSAEILVHQIQ